VTCAVREEIAHDVRPRLPEHRRPADDLELVPVAGANWVCAVLYEKSDDADVLLLRGEMEGHGIVAVVVNIWISAAVEQQSYDGLMASSDGEMKRRTLTEMAFEIPVSAGDSRIRIEQLCDARDVATCGRVEQRDERVLIGVEVLERSGECRPSRIPVLEREGVLDVAQRGIGRCVC